MPGYPWTVLLTLTLYVVLIAVIVKTQPQLAIGAGIMLGVLIIAGWVNSVELRLKAVGSSGVDE